MATRIEALITSKETPNLSGMASKDVVRVLKARATVLDVSTLSEHWQQHLATYMPSRVPGLRVPGEFGSEAVIVCSCKWMGEMPLRDAYTESEYDWLLVEVNALWRRPVPMEVSGRGKRMKIPFFCYYCNRDMVDKGELGFHCQQDLCDVYNTAKEGRLKIYPVNGLEGQKEIIRVFKKYNVQQPKQTKDQRVLSKKRGRAEDDNDEGNNDGGQARGSPLQIVISDDEEIDLDDSAFQPSPRKVRKRDMGPTIADLMEAGKKAKAEVQNRKTATDSGRCSTSTAAARFAPKSSPTPARHALKSSSAGGDSAPMPSTTLTLDAPLERPTGRPKRRAAQDVHRLNATGLYFNTARQPGIPSRESAEIRHAPCGSIEEGVGKGNNGVPKY